LYFGEKVMFSKHVSYGGTPYYLPGKVPFKKGDYLVINRDEIFGGLAGVVEDIEDENVVLYVPEWGEVSIHYTKLTKV